MRKSGKDDSEDERIVSDHDQPLSGAWLAAAYDAIFRPLEREDVDLEFDPDDEE